VPRLWLLGSDVAGAANTVREPEVAARDQLARHARLPLPHADIVDKVVTVH